jgi:hypothetical protein
VKGALLVKREEMAETEILEPYQLSFSDLLLSSRNRSQWISKNVMDALGPTGPGLLCITGVLGSAFLRRKLLPMARKLALLDPDKRKLILMVTPRQFFKISINPSCISGALFSRLKL